LPLSAIDSGVVSTQYWKLYPLEPKFQAEIWSL
jgi:hypothetical protein